MKNRTFNGAMLQNLVSGVTKMSIKIQLLLMKMQNGGNRMRKPMKETIVKGMWLEPQKVRKT